MTKKSIEQVFVSTDINSTPPRKSFNWSALGAIATVVSILVAVGSVYNQYSQKRREIKVEVLYVQKLNMLGSDDDLKVQFTYKRKEVVDPYRIGLRLINTGDVTLVAKGDSRNVIGDGLRLWIPKNYQIMKIIKEKCDLPLEIATLSLDSISLSFQQWKTGEFCSFSLYVTGTIKGSKIPFMELRERDIYEGTVIIEDSSTRPSDEKYKRYIDKYFGNFALIGSSYAFLVILSLDIIIFAFGIIVFGELLRNKMWKFVNNDSFIKYITSISGKLKEEECDKYIKDPTSLPEELWKGYNGPHIPEKNPALTSTTEIAVVLSLIILIQIGCVLSLMSLIYL
ncbi:hypothetical protein [Leptospira barantonii]|uniref:RING-type E3 ubiquitin transferase n=1 Tax=Leptospira barantonii TaxID=2023184 RepID=A0ABX4NLQ6_9LEPT|nr:hypothetical protein [Leptospira barantonii]PJZ57224.1 hypothetical protein CH367_10855 [Leptospira barantonii]